jgi:tetratricopeptide (TPR) repeat protein
MSSLGEVYLRQGKLKKSLKIFEEIVIFSFNKFGEKHKNSANALENLGKVYYEGKKYEKSRILLEKVMEIRSV